MEVESKPAVLCPDSLEKIFQRIEEESADRARNEALLQPSTSTSDATTSPVQSPAGTLNGRTRSNYKSRRRASISITRFGQLESEASLVSPPSTPTIKSALASPIYQTHLEAGSTDTLSSANLSDADDEHAHTEDHDHVTQVHRIAARQSVIARSIGNAIPRRLSRARSRPILTEGDTSNNMVIGVSIQAATVEVESSGDSEHPVGAVVHAPAPLKNQKSKSSLGSIGASSGGSVGGGGWIARAKSLTIKLRRKSRIQLAEVAT